MISFLSQQAKKKWNFYKLRSTIVQNIYLLISSSLKAINSFVILQWLNDDSECHVLTQIDKEDNGKLLEQYVCKIQKTQKEKIILKPQSACMTLKCIKMKSKCFYSTNHRALGFF